jgi:hypothetical protein
MLVYHANQLSPLHTATPISSSLTPSSTTIPGQFTTVTLTTTQTPIIITATPTIIFQQTNTVAPIVTNTSLPSPTLTQTSTLSPTLTHTPTLTPTLTISQWEEFSMGLLKSNAGCKLPCWWGITPGVTTWEEARRLLTYMGNTPGDSPSPDGSVFHGIGGYDWDSQGVYHRIGFRDRMGIVEAISVNAEGYQDRAFFYKLWQSYSPEQINTIYGRPTRVWVGFGGSETGAVYYRLFLIYDNLGFVIFNTGKALIGDEGGKPIYTACPAWGDSAWLPDLKIYIQSPESKTPLETLADITLSSIKPIEVAAGISVVDFYSLLLSEEKPACFNTHKSMWP